MTNITLNIQQTFAVNSTSRITYVNAGAGTGKTTTLEARIEKIARNTLPWNIIILAFNNSIVSDIKDRLKKHISAKKVDKMQIFTIHAYALKIISKQVKMQNELLDQEKLVKFIRNTWNKYKKLNNYKRQSRTYNEKKTRQVIDIVLKCRENNSYIKQCSKEMQLFYRVFKQELKATKSYDFARIVKVATKYIPQSNTPQYIFVDEFQDTSETRFNFIKALVGNNNYLFAVGDEYQQILEWSGVKNVNVSRLKRHYKQELSIYKLTYSYRLTPQLADISNRLLSFISDRKTTRKLRGCNNSKFTFDIKKFNSQKNETEWCIGYINELVKKGVNPKNIGVLYRNSNVIDQEVINTKVHCSTIHKAKGLEFDYVILLGLEDGVFPSKNSNVEEERRVLYVAITRAKKYLAITSLNDCYRNSIYVKGSSFLKYLI